MTITNIINDLPTIESKITNDLVARNMVEQDYKQERVSLHKMRKYQGNLVKARALIQKAAKITQQKLEYHISNLVSTALAAVWEDDPYEFKLEFVEKRGKTEAELYFVRDGEKMKPIDSAGGGAMDITSFALRVAFWSLKKTTRPVLFVDEPFRNLSKNLHDKAVEMIRMITENVGLQIIMISHLEKLIAAADKVFKIKLVKGESTVDID